MTTRTPSSPLRRVGVHGATGTLAAGGVAALLTALATPAGAVTTYTVDDASDGAPNAADCTTPVANSCSLRDAVAAANDGDTIVFAAGTTSITLTNGVLVTDAINIIGPGSATLAITTNGAAGAYNAFRVLGTGDVTLSGFTLTKNRIRSENAGDITLDDVVVDDSAGARGGAFYAANSGDVIITDSHFERNHSTVGGGAVRLCNGGGARITDSAFVDNVADDLAGAIDVRSALAGDVSILRSTITGNTAVSFGGGIYTDSLGNVTIADSVIRNNVVTGSGSNGSGGGAYLSHAGSLTIERTTVEGNSASWNGGGLYLSGSIDDTTILASTIAGNTTGTHGGGIRITGRSPLTIADSTLTGNSAGSRGGALYLQSSPVNLLQSTITQNSANEGGGLGISGTTAISMSGTILAGNTGSHLEALGTFDNIATDAPTSTFTSDHSIIGIVDGTVTITDLGGTIRTDDPGVSPLASNGGPTWTMALLATSPAVDTGPDPVAPFTGNQYDQRGPGYARIAFGRADIGAFEIQAPPSPDPGPEPAPEPVVPTFTG